mmetsp:Transcript_26211/g.53961  ORF Transcript_26211/g.53961 Transcript_26211/m.53961 type:complete len:270 (-) Transcript_26211:1670-2479(-)
MQKVVQRFSFTSHPHFPLTDHGRNVETQSRQCQRRYLRHPRQTRPQTRQSFLCLLRCRRHCQIQIPRKVLSIHHPLLPPPQPSQTTQIHLPLPRSLLLFLLPPTTPAGHARLPTPPFHLPLPLPLPPPPSLPSQHLRPAPSARPHRRVVRFEIVRLDRFGEAVRVEAGGVRRGVPGGQHRGGVDERGRFFRRSEGWEDNWEGRWKGRGRKEEDAKKGKFRRRDEPERGIFGFETNGTNGHHRTSRVGVVVGPSSRVYGRRRRRRRRYDL